MRIVKINGKEQIMKCNVGVLRKTAKQLGVKTPEIFVGIEIGDLEVGATLLFNSLLYSDRKFEMETIDELNVEEYSKLRLELIEEMAQSIPDATGGETTGKK